MVVRTQSKGRAITGLHVGVTNARRYFPRGTSSVEILLDHLQIQCALKPGFWEGEADIRDPRLNAWLEVKHPMNRVDQQPIALDLVPEGENSFRLMSMHVHPIKVPLSLTAA